MNKLEQNYQELESILSPDIHLYLDYFFYYEQEKYF